MKKLSGIFRGQGFFKRYAKQLRHISLGTRYSSSFIRANILVSKIWLLRLVYKGINALTLSLQGNVGGRFGRKSFETPSVA